MNALAYAESALQMIKELAGHAHVLEFQNFTNQNITAFLQKFLMKTLRMW